LALQLAAFFDLFFEKFFFVEWHGYTSIKRGRLTPDETASQIWGLQLSRRAPIPKARRSNPSPHCELARANPRRLIELFGVLQVSH
jgi:hypothetical protein